MFSADYLQTVIDNNQREHDSVRLAVKHLRWVIDSAAKRTAKDNANWHDDPEHEDYAAYHASDSDQFPRSVRDEVAVNLVKYWLTEFALQEQDTPKA